MNAVKVLTITAVLVVFIACDDDWVMDLTPPDGGWLWVVNNDLPGGAGDSSAICKLDLPSGRHMYEFGAPFRRGQNLGLAFGDGKVWVGGYNDDWDTGDRRGYYCGIDVETGERDPWVEIDTYPLGLAWDGEFLWSNDAGTFLRIDVEKGEYERMSHLDDLYVDGLASDGNVLWATDRTNKLIYSVNPETGEVLHRIPAPGGTPVGLAWDGEALWVNDKFGKIVYRVDPEDGKVLGYFNYNPWDHYEYGIMTGLAFEFPDGTGN